MSVARIELVLRFVGGAVAALGAWDAGRNILVPALPFLSSWTYLTYILLGTSAAVAYVIVFALAPAITTRPFFWLLRRATEMPASDVLVAAVGIIVGLLIGILVSIPLSFLPWYLGNFLPIVASLTLAYLGTTALVSHKREFFQIVRWPREGRVAASAGEGQRVLVDTSSIIDGRIADIAQTGFLSGPLVVPRFVLHELQRIADSPDPLRRGRGRRGLDILNRLQKEATVPLEIHEAQGDPNADVDIMLVSLARQLGCPIVTNDYNLNRVAGLQGVKVLNINELANAVKSMVLPGQELSLKIIQEGKELGQGVGYLEDGTMVVVENGRHAIGSDVTVTVSRVLQTVAGRMVFAQQKSGRDGHG
ncbi:MAG TPA: PIN domain-containing protein [Chloroflexota bacterium]|nr:PIN domain-containing protein [Chloroflexota bacterium]